MPPKQSHDFLQKWYAEFKKQVYEKAQIDMDRKEDIGRLKIYYNTKWLPENPISPEGKLVYACIPHEGLEYKNAPPSIDPVEDYLKWTQENLQVPTTDEEIEKLYDMSREGTLMAIEPGVGFHAIRQIYTDEKGNLSVSVPANELVEAHQNAPDEYKKSEQPREAPKMPDPASFGLTPPPKKPKEPKNMNPGFWAWLGSKLGFYTAYDEKLDYEEAMEEYTTKYAEWKSEQGDANARYEQACEKVMRDRDVYYKEVEEYLAKPINKLYAIQNGLLEQSAEIKEETAGKDGLFPSFRLYIRETEFMKEQHTKLPQGQYLKGIEEAKAQLALSKRTKNVVANLLAYDAEPNMLDEWKKRGVIKGSIYKLHRYKLPKMPGLEKASRERRVEFDKIWSNLSQVAGFAAFSHPDVLGKELHDQVKLSGFTAEENAKLNYSMALQNLFTHGRVNSDEYMQYLEPAREKANAAIHAYYDGELGPMAELLRNAIRLTNREVASLSILHTDHALNTLYLVGRMWEVLENDPYLMKEVGLTPEEMEETKGNVAMYSVMTKGAEAKQKLLEHALYKRTLTEQELQDYGCDLMLAQQLDKAIFNENAEADKMIEKSEGYKKVEALLEETDSAEKVARYYELIPRPAFNIAKNLLKENWIPDAKKALLENCNLDKLSTMNREEVGKVISSQIEFEKVFKQQVPKQQVHAMEQEVVPVKTNEIQGNVLG